MPSYYDESERDRRKLYWWSLAGLWFCCGLQEFIPEARYGWLMFALYPLYYCFRDTILFWRWSKNKEKEWDNIVKRIDKQIEEDMNEKQDRHN